MSNDPQGAINSAINSVIIFFFCIGLLALGFVVCNGLLALLGLSHFTLTLVT